MSIDHVFRTKGRVTSVCMHRFSRVFKLYLIIILSKYYDRGWEILFKSILEMTLSLCSFVSSV